MNRIRLQRLAGLRSLEELYLNSNQVYSIEKQSLKNVKKLKILNLAHNKIKSLDTDCFKYTKELRALDLKNNALKSIDSFWKWISDNLEILDPSHNQLKSIDSHLKFSKLRQLYLQSNQLSKQYLCDFVELKYLEILFLNENAIYNKNSDLSCFVDLTMLKELRIHSRDKNDILVIDISFNFNRLILFFLAFVLGVFNIKKSYF